MSQRSYRILAISFIFFLVLNYAQSQNTVNTRSGKLEIELAKLNNDPYLRHASWGFIVSSIDSGVTIAEFNSNNALVPASTLKAVTTAAALLELGAEYKFKTILEYSGNIDSTGTLHGDLYIKGGGDPTLASPLFSKRENGLADVLDHWSGAIKKAGIRKINGRVIADAGIFDDALLPDSWRWSDIGNYYGSGACGLSINDNTYEIYFHSEKPGKSTNLVKIEPEIPGLELINEVTAGSYHSGDNAFIFGAPYTYLRYIRGEIPAGRKNFSIKGSIPDPPLFCAYTLRKRLIEDSIPVQREPTTMRVLKIINLLPEQSDRVVIDTLLSPPLKDILYWTNMKSINLYAEHLLKYLGFLKHNEGSEDAGIRAIKDILTEHGVNLNGLYMVDGAGLSRLNTVTPEVQVNVLSIMAKTKDFKLYRASLPVAGESGSLAGMCNGTKAAGNLCAKSGYINRARGYTGYVKTKKGELLAFSMLANNFDCSPTEMKRKFERLMVLMAEL